MNRNRSHTPTAYTAEDRARMAAAVVRHDKALSRKAAINRLSRLAVVCIGLALTVALFYAATN